MSLLLLFLLPFFIFLYAISGFLRLLVRQQLSPLRRMPGPTSPSFFMGNLIEMHDQENNDLVARWQSKFGTAFVYKGFVGGCRLMTTDPRAIAHILGNAYDYPKPDFVRDSLASMAAGHNGLLTVEGEQHRRQRKILNPAFSAAHIKSLSPIFWQKATQLRDVWLSMAQTKNHSRVDVLSWLGRATLDVIGEAGFGYEFNSLKDEKNELARAFAIVFSTARKFRVMTILQVWFPFLRRFRRNNAVMIQAQETMRRVGLQLIEERKEAVAEEVREKKGGVTAVDGETTILGRDILSVLIRSNIASFDSRRMDVEEILCQISTFIAAGHETTASALTWCLYALSQHPAVQQKLRTELLSLPSYPPPQTDLALAVEHLPYLDAVVREALRLHAPITNTMRVCKRAHDEIPVMRPFRDREGRTCTSIAVKENDIISVPIQAVNKSRDIWGEDAHLFRPERWERVPEAADAIPGLYANTLTFLNGNPLNGNRACIGYKFALMEIKIFLFVLVRDIEFGIDPAMIIEKRVNVVTRPFVKSEPDAGNQLPLLLSTIRPPTSSHCPSSPSPT